MSNDHNHITYTAADIQRYLQGKLSPREMHALEKAALDDPFLADAIEGMQLALQEHDESLVTGQLQELHNQVQTRTTKPKSAPVIAFRWWQAAAAAVIVIAGALWIFNFSSGNKEILTVAKQEDAHQAPVAPAPTTGERNAAAADSASVLQLQTQEPAQPQTGQATNPASKQATQPQTGRATMPASQQAISPADTSSANEALTVEKPAPPVQQAAPPVSDKADTIGLASRKRQVNDLIAKNEVMRRAKQSTPPYTSNLPAVQRETVAAKTTTTTIAKKENEYSFNNRETELITIAKNDSQAKPAIVDNKNLSGVVKGRVTDPFHNPVANAYVTLPNNANYNMLTDKTGYFKLPATDSVVDVSVNVVGYGTQNFRLQNNASLNELQLQPANAPLNEVVVTAYGKGKKAKAQTQYPKVMVQDAEPVYGWLAYDQYLEKNKQRPANYPALTGNVVVSFVVNKKGELSNFNIEQSLAKPYNDEAIRLITQGPAWKLLKGRKAKITVIVKF